MIFPLLKLTDFINQLAIFNKIIKDNLAEQEKLEKAGINVLKNEKDTIKIKTINVDVYGVLTSNPSSFWSYAGESFDEFIYSTVDGCITFAKSFALIMSGASKTSSDGISIISLILTGIPVAIDLFAAIPVRMLIAPSM